MRLDPGGVPGVYGQSGELLAEGVLPAEGLGLGERVLVTVLWSQTPTPRAGAGNADDSSPLLISDLILFLLGKPVSLTWR